MLLQATEALGTGATDAEVWWTARVEQDGACGRCGPPVSPGAERRGMTHSPIHPVDRLEVSPLFSRVPVDDRRSAMWLVDPGEVGISRLKPELLFHPPPIAGAGSAALLGDLNP